MNGLLSIFTFFVLFFGASTVNAGFIPQVFENEPFEVTCYGDETQTDIYKTNDPLTSIGSQNCGDTHVIEVGAGDYFIQFLDSSNTVLDTVYFIAYSRYGLPYENTTSKDILIYGVLFSGVFIGAFGMVNKFA